MQVRFKQLFANSVFTRIVDTQSAFNALSVKTTENRENYGLIAGIILAVNVSPDYQTT